MSQSKRKTDAKVTLMWAPSGTPKSNRTGRAAVSPDTARTLVDVPETGEGDPTLDMDDARVPTDVGARAPWRPLIAAEKVPGTLRMPNRPTGKTVILRPVQFCPSLPAPTAAPPPHAEPAHVEAAEPGTRKPGRLDVMQLNKLVVSSYKVMGFAVLATILFGLGSFIFINIFYMVSRAWVTPMIISPTDPRVLQLNAQYASDRTARDTVAAQRMQLQANLADVKRIAASEGQFQTSFEEVMELEAASNDADLQELHKLLGDLQRTRGDLNATSAAYTKVSKEELRQEIAAGLIDKDQATRGGYELSQIAGANLAIHEKHVEIDSRIGQLERMVSSLKGGKTSSYDVLHMQHEYEQSKLASEKAGGDADALANSIAMFDQAIANYDTQLGRIEKAPYLRAADKSVSTAFIPYDNVTGVSVGDGVYACALSVFWCKRVGTVAELLDGEVIEKHPLHNRDLRGVLARLTIDSPAAMQQPVLHLRHAPLGI